jgi:tetratricopeptide (TPR) repeat protein
MMESTPSRSPEECPVPPDPARNRLLETLLDPAKIIAGLLVVAVPVVVSVFKLAEELPDSIKHQVPPEQRTGIVTVLLWSAIAIALILWNHWQDRRRHPDGKPKPGNVAIYVAELEGDDKNGLHRTRIVRSLEEHLGKSVQLLRAGIPLRAQEKGNPEDDARAANRKGLKFLNLRKHKGDLLIWGQVLDEKKLVELRFISHAHDGTKPMPHTFTEKLLLAPDFGPELAAALAAIAAQLALPAVNPGSYVADVLIPVAEKLSKIVANLPVSMGPDQRGLLLLSYANAESAIGEQSGDSDPLDRAIAAYRSALKVSTREKFPLDWAATQISLGIALATLGARESGTEHLEAAVAAFREALKERTREKLPLQWATTQNNLGGALSILGERESGTESLKAAVAAHLEALKELTREKVPLDWAMTQNNLGIALLRLGERESGTEYLEAAVAAYREALKEYTREKVPLDWAMTQTNLGLALFRIGERENGTELLEAAIVAFREALKEYSREKVPLQWAGTQNNLGNALLRLGERESGTKRVEAAVAAYREALKEWTREKVPLDWAMTQNNLGNALESMGKLEDAANSYRLALQVLTPENHFPRYTMATDNLTHVLEKLRAAKENE